MHERFPSPEPASSPQAIAVRYLTEHGYERTTAGELADAMGMSRSTFFRRFRSKEDVVFVDHDLALRELEQQLEAPQPELATSLVPGTLSVFEALTRDPETARQRFELLRATPSLRERELVITHRYERVFARHLARSAPEDTPTWVPVALAASVVAVHNAALRRWLRSGSARGFAALERELEALTDRFAPWFGGPRHASRVVVASFDTDTPTEEILRAVAEELSAQRD